MKKLYLALMTILILMNLLTAVLNPVWCYESSGLVTLEWMANCVPGAEDGCFDMQAIAIGAEHLISPFSIPENLAFHFVSLQPVPTLERPFFFERSWKNKKFQSSLGAHFFPLDSVALLI